MVDAIHNIGKAMNIQTIAEFVENDDIIATLRDIGVDYAQGYGVHRPEAL
jgi:EAL domain-containing protein (putative c-di-GMP-specific phosphodiesterase class I)